MLQIKQKVKIRELTSKDKDSHSAMRLLLWPYIPQEELEKECDWLYALAHHKFYGAFLDDDLIAFAEISLRSYVDDSENCPVAYIEGIYVLPEYQKLGIGKKLLQAIEADLLKDGYLEICSDAFSDNIKSHHAHKSWGFETVQETRLFRKSLKNNDIAISECASIDFSTHIWPEANHMPPAKHNICYVAKKNKQTIAYCIFEADTSNANILILKEIQTHPEYRLNGIARKMLNFASFKLKEPPKSYSHLLIKNNSQLTGIKGFLKSCLFHEITVGEHRLFLRHLQLPYGFSRASR